MQHSLNVSNGYCDYCPLISLPQIKLQSVLTASAQSFIYLSIPSDPVPLAIFSKQKEKLTQFIRKCA